ncbi:MAG: hypothetical protein HYV75_04545 [Opitutae bacterium]|nr:hypothetical protein [Opitutae bacterium]
MVEVQFHGFTFEKWVRDTIFGGYQGDYMQRWDVPPEANICEIIPAKQRGLPVSIKSAKYGSPIGLGDILRQRQIDRPFLMIVGFWCQRVPSEKWFEEIDVAHFSEKTWSTLWGGLTVENLRQIDAVVKNLSEHYSLVRKQAQTWKRTTAEVATSRIVVNPKIDSKSQRRIQCSLPFDEFWRQVGRVPVQQAHPKLFGRDFPNPIRSSSRTFN